LADDQRRDEDEIVHYEGGIPVFNTRLDKLEKDSREAKDRDDKYKQEQITLNRRLVWFTGVLAVVGLAGSAISGYQAHVAKINAIAAQDNAKAASDNATTSAGILEEMKKSGTDTHKLAVAAGSQAIAAQTTASAAHSAAVIAKDTLHISERAYVTQGSPQIDTAKSFITIPIVNSGHIPSGKVEVLTYESTLNPEKMTEGSTSFKDMVERHKSTTSFASIPPGTPPPLSIGIPIPKMSKDRLDNGTQLILIVGTITYNDGFPNSPMQQSPFCTQTIYQTVAKQVYLAPCNAVSEFPKFEAMDWTGLTQ
jgi:hypothetical protein